MADLTDAEIAELRKVFGEPLEPESWHDGKVLRLIDEVERRRKEMDAMIPVRSYRCVDCGEMVPDNMPVVERHLRSERHLAALSAKKTP